MNWKTRVFCHETLTHKIGTSVTLYGWVDASRDHGHVVFVHLRDSTGMIQIVCHPEAACHAQARHLRNEDVLEVRGTLVERSSDTINPRLETGHLEVVIDSLTVLNPSLTPPFEVSEKNFLGETLTHKVDEELRLKYRYLDLRRPSMQTQLRQRYALIKQIRDYLHDHQFVEIETPVLTKSTPEGARDYLVPSRVHAHHFYALPQSPQLFKQLLMMGGFERYFQIVKCFRDEDLRPNRQPEFTQMDLEASFIDESYIFELIEGLISRLFNHIGASVSVPFPRMPYAEAIEKYGNDRPDIRFGWTMKTVTDIFGTTDYKIFRQIVAQGGLIKGITMKGMASRLSKNVLQDELAKTLIPKLGGKGMTWMKVENGQLESNIVQFFSETEREQVISQLGAEDGDVVILIADTNHDLVNHVLGQFRLIMAKQLGVIPEHSFGICWVVDFPLFERSETGISAMHHPFTQAQTPISSLDPDHLLSLKARAYDLVINGDEVGGGSIRMHHSDEQILMLKALGMDDQKIDSNFGFFVKALRYGTPPHGGIALGIDRLVSMLLGVDSIREVIAFPKNRMAVCPLTQSPDLVAQDQLDELHLNLAEANQEAHPS